jgi:hypothetical protein
MVQGMESLVLVMMVLEDGNKLMRFQEEIPSLYPKHSAQRRYPS